ncbi:NAD(P)H-dependent flavin oxidoreductase [Neisseria sp.]|uniref:NAD(P)H-dependent flavin oxidoreductase n=1 Tax=Neisseria sp. TaxID=192066 RepID=UPI0035A1676F
MQRLSLKLKHPVIQAPMAGVQGARLAIAACRAGIVGSLPAAMLSPDALRGEIASVRAAVADAPFNVNFFAHTVPQISAAQHEAWLDLLQPLFNRFGLNRADIPQGGGRRAFDDEALAVVQELRPPVVSFHFGLPEKRLLDAVKATGAQVWSSATTVEEARWLETHGADAVIAQGQEAGGHRGLFLSREPQAVGTFELLSGILNTVRLPVIAAGGISGAAAVRAAIDAGAAAVQVGTAFMLADEADTRAEHRAALQNKNLPTAVTNLFTGGYARGLENPLMRELGSVRPEALPFPFAAAAVGALRQAAEPHGCADWFAPMWAGQNYALAEAGSTAEIVERLTAEL